MRHKLGGKWEGEDGEKGAGGKFNILNTLASFLAFIVINANCENPLIIEVLFFLKLFDSPELTSLLSEIMSKITKNIPRKYEQNTRKIKHNYPKENTN